MPMTWDAAADARLLHAIIKTAPKIDWKTVAGYMGEDCTEYALQHRIRKLQKLAAGKDGASAPTTPAKSPKTVTKPRTERATSAKPRARSNTPHKRRLSVIKNGDAPDEHNVKKAKKEEPSSESDSS